jgi:RND family efflux transporter MFP subunit
MRRTRCTGRGPCAALGLALAVCLTGGCGESAAPTAGTTKTADDSEAPVLSVVEVTARAWPHVVRTQGTLVEDESANLSAKVAGRIEEMLVDFGDTVAAGQPVAKLDTEEFDLRVRQAEAQVAQARAIVGLKGDAPDNSLDPAKAAPVMQEYAMLEDARLNVLRTKSVSARSAFTQEEIQTRESALRVAEARYASALNQVHEQIAALGLRRVDLALAQQNRKDAVVTAPFAGVIRTRYVAPGSYVNVGQQIATLVRVDPLRFRTGVPERAAAGVAVGQKVKVLLDGQTSPIEAQISRISPALEVSSRALTVEASVPNPDGRWRSGLFAEGEILIDQNERTLAVPLTSVVTFGGVEKVWSVKENKAEPRMIRTGRREGGFVEVIGGLEAGDVVLSNGQLGREGFVRVEPQPPAATGRPDDRATRLRQ